jgi:mutator protein MutT
MGDEAVIEGVVAVIPRDGRWLATRRAEGIAFGGWWCFPGGGIEPGERPTEALVREVREEVGLEVEPIEQIWQWERSDGQLVLYWYLTRPIDDTAEVVPSPHEVAETRWVTPSDFSKLEPILASNLAFLQKAPFTASHGRSTL